MFPAQEFQNNFRISLLQLGTLLCFYKPYTHLCNFVTVPILFCVYA